MMIRGYGPSNLLKIGDNDKTNMITNDYLIPVYFICELAYLMLTEARHLVGHSLKMTTAVQAI